MKTLYEERSATPLRTRDELLKRRIEKRERIVRKRRIGALRFALIAVFVVLIGINILDPNYVLAGGAIWSCIPAE